MENDLSNDDASSEYGSLNIRRRQNRQQAVDRAREVIGWGENRLADIFEQNPILFLNFQSENVVQQQLDDEAEAPVTDMAVDNVDSDDDHALLDEGQREEPVVSEDERLDGCYCQRCPVLGGEEEACCDHVDDRCLSLRVALSLALAAENEPETVAKREAEARKLFVEWEKEVTVDRTQRHHAYKRVERWYIEETALPMRHKIPNCVEKRIRDTWPSPTGVYTTYKKPDPRRAGRGRGKRTGTSRGRQQPAKRGRRTISDLF